MTALLEEGMDPSATNKIGQTGLHVAAIWGNIEVAEVLIRYGADVNARNQFGITPLHMASQSSKHAVAKLLIECGADPSIKAGNGMRAHEVAKDQKMRELCGAPSLKAHAAVIADDVELLRELLANGIELSEQDAEGETPLHLAVKAALGECIGDEPLVEEEEAPAANSACLEMILGEASRIKSAISSTATDDAMSFAVLAAKQAISSLTSAQSLHNAQGLMPIHIAAEAGSLAVCEKLLTHGAPVNANSLRTDGQHSGQWGKNVDGKIEKLDNTDQTALHLAVIRMVEQAEEAGEDAPPGDPSLVRLLLEHKASPNLPNIECATPLHLALMGGLNEVVELLVLAKADLSLGCKAFGKDNTALHQATLLRNVHTIKLLTKYGAAVDAVGRDGWTPLGLAVRSNAVDAAKALLEAKADVHKAASGNGKTPLEIASINKKPEITKLLEAAAGVEPQYAVSSGWRAPSTSSEPHGDIWAAAAVAAALGEDARADAAAAAALGEDGATQSTDVEPSSSVADVGDFVYDEYSLAAPEEASSGTDGLWGELWWEELDADAVRELEEADDAEGSDSGDEVDYPDEEDSDDDEEEAWRPGGREYF